MDKVPETSIRLVDLGNVLIVRTSTSPQHLPLALRRIQRLDHPKGAILSHALGD